MWLRNHIGWHEKWRHVQRKILEGEAKSNCQGSQCRNMKLELYLGHISIKAALFGPVQPGCCQNKVWQRQIKKPLYQPRETQNGGNPSGIISCDYPPPPIPQPVGWSLVVVGVSGGVNTWGWKSYSHGLKKILKVRWNTHVMLIHKLDQNWVAFLTSTDWVTLSFRSFGKRRVSYDPDM